MVAPMMIAGEAMYHGAVAGSHPWGFGAASAGALSLLVATALCMWWHRRRKRAPEEAADKEQLRKDLLHAHDSVVVAKKRITGEEVKTGASIPANFESSDDGSNCGNSSGGAGAGRVPMVAFLDLPEEEQKRLRAGNINDSVLIMRNKRATSGASSPAKGGEAAVAYYQQQLVQLQSSSDGSSSSGSSGRGAEGAARMPGQLRGRSSDGSESGKRVQFGAAQVMAVSTTAGLALSAAGDVSAAGTAMEAGIAAAVSTVPDCVQPEHGAAAGSVLLPGGVDGDSISIDTSELGAGQRHSRGDDMARIGGAQLPGSAS